MLFSPLYAVFALMPFSYADAYAIRYDADSAYAATTISPLDDYAAIARCHYFIILRHADYASFRHAAFIVAAASLICLVFDVFRYFTLCLFTPFRYDFLHTLRLRLR